MPNSKEIKCPLQKKQKIKTNCIKADASCPQTCVLSDKNFKNSDLAGNGVGPQLPQLHLTDTHANTDTFSSPSGTGVLSPVGEELKFVKGHKKLLKIH